MRRFVSFLLIFLLCITPVSAHSGRTDGNGGHYNRSTGEYHYHHGYSAHQHTDLNGDGKLECPYEFKDLTGTTSGSPKSSSNSSYKSSYTTPTLNPEPIPTTPKSNKSSVSSSSDAQQLENKGGSDMIGWIFSGILILFMVSSSSSHQKEYSNQKHIIWQREKELNEYKIESVANTRKLTSSFQSKIEELETALKSSEDARVLVIAESDRLRSDLCQEREQKERLQSELDRILFLSEPFEDESLEDRNAALSAQIVQKENLIHDQAAQIQKMAEKLDKYTQMQNGSFYGDDGLPIYYKAASKKYGDYTAYVNQRTGIYHLDPKCAPNNATVMHVSDLSFLTKPCSKCAPYGTSGLPMMNRKR